MWTGGCELGDGWILKLNQNGDTLWTKKFDNNGKCDCFNNIEISSDGGFIIIGDSYTSSGIGDIYLVKTDNQGIEEWHQIYSETSQEGNDVKQTTDGGYIIVGELQIPPIWEENVFLIKYNSQGDTLWTKTFGGGDSDYGNSVQQTSDGGYIITGAYDYYGNGSVYLIKTDGQGNTLWINELDNPLVKLYPNPTSDQITIDIKGYSGVVNVEVYDLQGRLLETTTNTIVSLKNHAKGIYVLKVSYGEVTEEVRVVRD